MNEIHDCRECRKYGTDYDCRENCEGRDMFEPIKKKEKEKELKVQSETFKAELEEIKAELHKRIKIQYDACFGDDEDVYCFHKAYQISHIIVDNVFEKYLKEIKQ